MIVNTNPEAGWDEEEPTELTELTELTLERGNESKRMAKFMESNLFELCVTFEKEARAYITWFNANSGEGSQSDFTSETSPHKGLTLIDRANMGRFVVQDAEARFQRVAELYSKLDAYTERYMALSSTDLEFGLTPDLESMIKNAGMLWSLMNDLGGKVFEATAQGLRAELEAFWANCKPVEISTGVDPTPEVDEAPDADEPSLNAGGTSPWTTVAEV